MSVHIEIVAALARFYPTPEPGYDRHESFEGVCNLFWLGPHHVFVFGLHARARRKYREEFEQELRARGVTTAVMIRHNRFETLFGDGIPGLTGPA